MCGSFFSLSPSLSKTHIKSTHPYITDSSFQSDFKLPCILVKHCQDPFFIIPPNLLCLRGQRLLPSLTPPHSSASMLSSEQQQTSDCTLTPTELHTTLHQHIRTGQHGRLLPHTASSPPLPAFCGQPNPLATNCDLFLIKKTAKQFCMPVQCVRF